MGQTTSKPGNGRFGTQGNNPAYMAGVTFTSTGRVNTSYTRANAHREIRNRNDVTSPNYNPAEIASVTIHPEVIVAQGLFSQYKNLRSIVIPEGSTIGKYAFDNNKSLTSIVILQRVRIEEWAFCGCTSLTSIDIPERANIEAYAFWRCTSLTSIVIPKMVTIGQEAFYNCAGLASIIIHQGVTIGRNAFSGCTSLRSVSVMCSSESEQATWRAANSISKFPPGVIFTFVLERAITNHPGEPT